MKKALLIIGGVAGIGALWYFYGMKKPAPVVGGVKPPTRGTTPVERTNAPSSEKAVVANRPMLSSSMDGSPGWDFTDEWGEDGYGYAEGRKDGMENIFSNASGCPDGSIKGCSLWSTDKAGNSVCKVTTCRPFTPSTGAGTMKKFGAPVKFGAPAFQQG